MIPFNPTQFKIDFPQFTNYSDTSLYNWYNEGINGVGVPVLALCNQTVPSLTWDAATNTPTLVNGTKDVDYLCNVAGSANFGAGTIPFTINQVVSYNTTVNMWTNLGYPMWYFFSCQILAHLLTLNDRGLVGIINNAKGGTVNVGLEAAPYNYWNQTTYGAKCYELFNIRGGFTTFCSPDYNGLFL